MTQKLLECMGMEPARIRLEWISASEASKFAQVITDFVEAAREIGPNPFCDRGKRPWMKHDFRAADLS